MFCIKAVSDDSALTLLLRNRGGFILKNGLKHPPNNSHHHLEKLINPLKPKKKQIGKAQKPSKTRKNGAVPITNYKHRLSGLTHAAYSVNIETMHTTNLGKKIEGGKKKI